MVESRGQVCRCSCAVLSTFLCMLLTLCYAAKPRETEETTLSLSTEESETIYDLGLGPDHTQSLPFPASFLPCYPQLPLHPSALVSPFPGQHLWSPGCLLFPTPPYCICTCHPFASLGVRVLIVHVTPSPCSANTMC